jgi:hypothetical protein
MALWFRILLAISALSVRSALGGHAVTTYNAFFSAKHRSKLSF